MKRRVVEQWSVFRSLALLAAIFAIVVGATLPTAVAASPGVGHAIQLCSGERIFLLDDGSGPAPHDPGPADSLDCADCLAAAFVALTPRPPVEAPAPAPCPGPDAQIVPAPHVPAHAVRLAPRPPSTAPPIA